MKELVRDFTECLADLREQRLLELLRGEAMLFEIRLRFVISGCFFVGSVFPMNP